MNVEQSYVYQFLFSFNLGFIDILFFLAFLDFFFGNDNENKKSENVTYLGMIQTIIDQNLSAID